MRHWIHVLYTEAIRVIPKKKALMTMHLVRRNVRSVPWVAGETLAPIGKQDSTGYDLGPRTSKSSSPPEEPDNMILRGYCGPEGPRGFGPFHLKPKAHVEEEEVSGDEWRESKLPECIAEDDPVLGRPKSWEKKLPHRPRTSTRGSPKRFQAIWASHRGVGGEVALGKTVTSVLNTYN